MYTAYTIAILITPQFNMAATTAFIDPLRAANYLAGQTLYRWHLLSLAGGPVYASNGLQIQSDPLSGLPSVPDMAMVSASWTPEAYAKPPLLSSLRKWHRFGAALGALDTGAFLLAEAGLLSEKRATVHFEHFSAFAELYGNVGLEDRLVAIDGEIWTAGGGMAGADLALHLIRSRQGPILANQAARYIFHDRLREPNERQQAGAYEPVAARLPNRLKRALDRMAENLEEPLAIGRIAKSLELSQRQLERLFRDHIGKSPARYYTDLRLERARHLLTQTEMPIWEIAVACGFASPEHFSRAYKTSFGLSPRQNRIAGRIAFEFRQDYRNTARPQR